MNFQKLTKEFESEHKMNTKRNNYKSDYIRKILRETTTNIMNDDEKRTFFKTISLSSYLPPETK